MLIAIFLGKIPDSVEPQSDLKGSRNASLIRGMAGNVGTLIGPI